MLTIFPTADRSPGHLKDAIWIDLRSPSEAEVAEAAEATGLRIPTREEISAIEASSRLQRVGKALYLSTPMLSVGDEPHLSPVGFVLTPERLITVRFDPFGAFETAAENALADEDISSLGVFTCVFESVVDRLADSLEECAAGLDQISRGIFHQPGRKRGAAQSDVFQRRTLAQVGRIGERLSHTRDVLLGIGRIVQFVMEIRHDKAAPADAIAARMQAVKQDILSLNDYESQLANKVQFLLDAVLGFISISQNDIFKVLTVWSIVGIPPTLVAGIWGMNFKAMPELQWSFGYPFGLAVIVVSAVLPLAWFKWKGWL